MATIEKRERTPEEIADAARLRAIWVRVKDTDQSKNQKWLSEVTGLGNQSTISQYMNGPIQLNEKAVLAFANALGVHPSEISPRMNFPASAEDTFKLLISAEEVSELVRCYAYSEKEGRDAILKVARSSAKFSISIVKKVASDNL